MHGLSEQFKTPQSDEALQTGYQNILIRLKQTAVNKLNNKNYKPIIHTWCFIVDEDELLTYKAIINKDTFLTAILATIMNFSSLIHFVKGRK